MYDVLIYMGVYALFVALVSLKPLFIQLLSMKGVRLKLVSKDGKESSKIIYLRQDDPLYLELKKVRDR